MRNTRLHNILKLFSFHSECTTNSRKQEFPFELGKYHKSFKICFFPDGGARLKPENNKVELEIEGLCGYHSFAGDTLAECIAEALVFYYEQGTGLKYDA